MAEANATQHAREASLAAIQAQGEGELREWRALDEAQRFPKEARYVVEDAHRNASARMVVKEKKRIETNSGYRLKEGRRGD